MNIINCGDPKWNMSKIGKEHGGFIGIPSFATQVYYWYEGDCLEGDGEMLLHHKNGKWHYYNMGHCSCCGPLDNFHKLKNVDPLPLDELLASMTEELRERCEILVKEINK